VEKQVLAGCGVLDGTDISEAISVAIHLSRHNYVTNFYAPNINVCGTVNHFCHEIEECNGPRNALVEAARIARGLIQPLCYCKACEYTALILPGGWGTVRTL
jgi:enhancing lycopene biosynthesis protein 2